MHRAVGTDELRIDANVVRDGLEQRMVEILEGVERNLNDLVQGLGLLGLKRCSQCRRFFRSSDPGALFGGGGELVCFECIPEWWPSHRERLTCEERQETESRLVFWLRNFHNARTLNGAGKLKGNQTVKFELEAHCLECRGTGIYMGDKRCRYCAGPGTVRVMVPEVAR